MNTSQQLQQRTSGIFPRLWARLFGSDAARLRERIARAHWLSYVLIIAQSATVLLVFGHSEIPLLAAARAALGVRLIAALGIFVLVASVFAADMAMLSTLKRIPALARNRQRWQLREHVAYVLFVLATEAVTLAVVLAALDAAPGELISPQPLIVPGSALFQAAIALRVLLVSWSAVQLVIVRGRLPVLLSTLTATGREIVGAHVEGKLAALDIEGISLPAAFRTYAAMSKPPRRVPTWWNGWLVRRDAAAEAEEARQVASVVDALDELEARQSLLVHPALPAPILPSSSLSAHAGGSPQGQNGTIPMERYAAIPAPASALTRTHTRAPAEDGPEDGPEDPPPEPPTPPTRPNGHHDGAHAGADGREDPLAGGSIRLVPALAGRSRRAAGKMSADDARRVHAFALLDADPRMSKAELRKRLRTRQTTADSLYAEWHHARARQRRQVAAAAAGAQ
ncbi:MAG TPA: hypothetical protein VF120_14305 [Ktedonobacterales bacterium]